MKKMVILFLFASISLTLLGQNTNGKIVGKLIENNNSRAVPGETVLLFKGENQFASARSGAGGNFSFVSVESGDYSLKVTKSGYQSYSKKIRINPNFTSKIVVALEPNQQDKESSFVQRQEDRKNQEQKLKPENLMGSNQKPEIKLASASDSQSTLETKNQQPIVTEPEQIIIDANTEPIYYDAVEEMPEPVDGLSALMKNIEYPENALKLGIQGTVYLQAFISKDGEVTNILIMKSIPMLDLSAQEAVYKTKFKPGKIGGEIVDSKLTIPIPFKLKR